MRIPIAGRVLSLCLMTASLLPVACRDDADPPVIPDTGVADTNPGGPDGGSNPPPDGSVEAADAVADGAEPDGTSGEVGAETGGDASAPDAVTVDATDTAEVPPPAATTLRPFYSAPNYPAGVIRPTGAQATLDNATAASYTRWKRDHVVAACGGSFVQAPSDVGANTATTSEIHGAGMIATVIFAGHDADAKAAYDGLFRVARLYRSAKSPDLMAARVARTGTGPCSAPALSDAQTDGDLHIALSLLMADKQWGSAGTVNYLDEGKKTIAAIKQYLMNSITKLPFVGDYAAADPLLATRVRSSDLLPGHFQAFSAATGDVFWTEAITASYELIGRIQSGPALATGLLPDFIINTATPLPGPATGGTDGYYYYHAARVPLYLGLDFISNSTRTQNSKAALEKIAAWVRAATTEMPSMVVDGYQLSGAKRPGGDTGESPLFETPFGVAALFNPANQAWVDAVWVRGIRERAVGVIKDSNVETVQLLSLVALSGHWWAP